MHRPTIALFVSAVAFVLRVVLPKLVEREVWNSAVLFEGFVKCVQQTRPDSFEVRCQGSFFSLSRQQELTPQQFSATIYHHPQLLQSLPEEVLPRALEIMDPESRAEFKSKQQQEEEDAILSDASEASA